MVNKEMKFLDNGNIRYEIVDEAARSDIQTINTVLDTKADTSNVTALDTRVTGVEDDCYNSYAVGTASGTVASFSDGADDLPIKSLMVDINPVQDLHGYDSPWVGGGGKNKIPYPYYSQAGTLDGVTYTIGDDGKLTATGTTERGTNFFFVRNVVLTAGTYTASVSGDFVGPTFMIYDQVNKVTICNILPAESTHYKTFTIESDKTVNIYLNTSQTGLTFNVSAYFQLEQGSTATTYTPYKNICPISGWTGVQVIRTGKNLLPNLKFQNAPSTVGIGQTEYVSSNQKIYLSAGTYTLSTVTTASGRCYYKKKGGANTAIGSSSQVNPNGTFTITETGFYAFWIYNGNGFSADDLISFQLEKSTTATKYEPYNGTTIPIDWQSEVGTVYGGKLNVLTGELTVDKAMVDLRTLNWTYTSDTGFGYNFFTCSSFTNRKRGSVYLICDRYATASGGRNTMISDAMISSYNVTNSQSICIRDDRYTTISDFVASLDDAKLVYELATPITIQLTPHEIKSLLGANNIFADTGDTKVEYRADTTLYIERLIESNVDRAEEAKIDAQNSATQAGQSASQALTYKTDTESARDEVQSIVDSISANASQIDTNTENIASLEEDRYKPYVTDSASGAVASFTDGADDLPLKSLVVNIDPVQDLHGYDSPWVGGTGINLLKPVETTVTSNGIVATGYEDGKVTVTGTATSDAQVELFLVSVAERRYYLILKDDINGSADTWWVSISGVAPIYSGHVNSTNFYSTGNYKLRINVKSGITINQTFYPMVAESETTYVPYENICPISGWEGMTVNACGKNLLNPNYSAYQTGYSYLFMNDIVPEGQTARFTFIDKDTSVDVSGMSIGFQNGVDLKHTAPTTYNWATRGAEIQSNVTNVRNGITCSGIFIYPKTKETFDAIFSRWDIMVELGSTATDYEPYSEQTIPVDWQTEAGTVYGGHLDVLSGVLTIIDKHKVITDADRIGNYGDTGFTFMPNDMKSGMAQSGLCNLAPTVQRVAKYGVVFGSNNSTIYFAQAKNVWGVTEPDDAKQWAIDHGLELVYPLATPITIQLTSHEVRSLLGQNNIFADTGDCSVEYRADTKLYIERLTAPDSADMIADSNIVSGQYFMVSNALYKATTNIANGGQIIVGTNCTKISLATALNEINA